MKLMIELKERGRVIGLKRIIGIESLIERLIGRLIGRFCRALGAEIVHFCCRILLGNVDIRRVKEGISIEVSSSFVGLVLKPSFAVPLVV
jgi:hypothetical protein